MICRRMEKDGINYLPHKPAWTRSKFPKILCDQCYIGDRRYRGQWHDGTHESIVDYSTSERVQSLLGGRIDKTNELLYAGGMIRYVHCDGQVTGERLIKKTPGKKYIDNRCTMYNRGDQPRVRTTAKRIDEQMLALFARMKQRDTLRD